jgi:hypothetical protein
MATIYLGPDNKNLGLSFNHIYTGNLPVANGDFPLHIKEAVLANPLLENSFMSFDRYVARRPAKSLTAPAQVPVVRQGPPIKKRQGLQKN